MNYQGIRYEHVPNGGPGGTTAQCIDNRANRSWFGLVQRDVAVYAGERLGITLWARCQTHAARLVLALRPLSQNWRPYASVEVVVDTPWYAEYRAELSVDVTVPSAVFTIGFPDEGEALISWIRLEPVGAKLLSPTFLAALERLPVPVLRWHGGCITTAYHWRHGVLPPHLRPTAQDFVFKAASPTSTARPTISNSATASAQFFV
jgi:hypothetical protein